jgi:hypothetical protein
MRELLEEDERKKKLLVTQNSSQENSHFWFQWVPLNKISFIEVFFDLYHSWKSKSRLEKFLRIGLILHFRPSSSKWVFKAFIVFFYVFLGEKWLELGS